MGNNEIVRKETSLKNQLKEKHIQIKALLNGDAQKTTRFVAAALQVSLDKELMSCTEDSIIDSIMKIALLDLNVDKNVGEAYLIKYGNACTMQIGYKGWNKIMYRAGYDTRTFPVFKCDDFDCSFDGWNNNFILKPNFEERDIGNFDWEFENLRGVLVVSKDLITNEYKRDFIPKKTLEKMRKASPNQKTDTPTYIWKDWYIDMCQGKSIKKFKNLVVLKDNIQLAFELDESNKKIDAAETKKQGFIIDAEVSEKKGKIQQPTDLNSLSNTKKDDAIDIEIEAKQPTPKEMMVKELMDRGASQMQAGKWCYNKSDETLNQYLNDPASIDTALADAVGM